MTHTPDPQHVRDALDAVEAVSSGEWSLADARAVLGDDALVDGLLGAAHVLCAVAMATTATPAAAVWSSARSAVDLALTRAAS